MYAPLCTQYHSKVDARQESKNTHDWLNEYQVGDFYRSFRLSEQIDTGKIEAKLNNGVLEGRLPKTTTAKPRKITVDVQ